MLKSLTLLTAVTVFHGFLQAQAPDVSAIARAIQSAIVAPPSPMYTGVYGGATGEATVGDTCSPVVTVPYTAFAGPATSANVALMVVPDRWSPRTVLAIESAQFLSAAPQTTTFSYCIGAIPGACGTTPPGNWYYIEPTPLGRVSPTNWNASAVDGQPAQLASHTLWLTVIITNVNPGTTRDFTAGAITVVACGRQLPGPAIAAYSPAPSSTWTAGARSCVSTYSAAPFPPGGSPWIARCN